MGTLFESEAIVALGVGANLAALVQDAADSEPTKAKLVTFAVDRPSEALEAETWARRSDLHAAILILDREAAGNDRFLDIIARFLSRATSIDFGLFVFDPDQILGSQIGKQGVLGRLGDTVQTSKTETLSGVLRSAHRFVRRAPTARLAAQIERAQIESESLIGKAIAPRPQGSLNTFE